MTVPSVSRRERRSGKERARSALTFLMPAAVCYLGSGALAGALGWEENTAANVVFLVVAALLALGLRLLAPANRDRSVAWIVLSGAVFGLLASACMLVGDAHGWIVLIPVVVGFALLGAPLVPTGREAPGERAA